MSADDPVPRFFAFLLAFMGAMNGVVLSGNLVQIVFFWELTSLFSFLLIGYWHHASAARDGARMALTVTAAGGLALFAGVLVLGHIIGGYDLDAVLASGDRVREHPLHLTALLLILLGALTKSAQFPFHFWLLHAMAAPTPVSAYLHSATLENAATRARSLLRPSSSVISPGWPIGRVGQQALQVVLENGGVAFPGVECEVVVVAAGGEEHRALAHALLHLEPDHVAPEAEGAAEVRHRGTAEQWIKEGKAAVRWTRLSCRSFATNAVRLQLHALASRRSRAGAISPLGSGWCRGRRPRAASRSCSASANGATNICASC